VSRVTAFDRLAEGYDADFTDTLIGRMLRARVHHRLDRLFGAGDHVLELGCGTGQDALRLAERGLDVTATDASQAMLEVTQRKAAKQPGIRTARLDLNALDDHFADTVYDGVFSNFGPLNCLSDWRPLAAWLADRVRPGGKAAFGIMSPFCAWETLWHAAHFDFRIAFRRWRKDTIFVTHDAALPMQIAYPTIRRITRDFAPHFRRVHVEAIGLFLPPTGLFGAAEKRPRLLRTLSRLEDRFGRVSPLALLADHYWIELERR
jgi:SAM-dependent methyltransferase